MQMPSPVSNQARRSNANNSVVRRQDSRLGPPSRAFTAQAMTSASFGITRPGKSLIAQIYLPSQGRHPTYEDYNDVRIKELEEDYRDAEAVEVVETYERFQETPHYGFTVDPRQQRDGLTARPNAHQEEVGQHDRHSTAARTDSVMTGKQGTRPPYSHAGERGTQPSLFASRPAHGGAVAGSTPRPRGAFPAGPGAQRASKLREVHNASPDTAASTGAKVEPIRTPTQEQLRPAAPQARAPGRQDMYEQYLRETKKAGNGGTKEAENTSKDGNKARMAPMVAAAPFRTPARSSPSTSKTGASSGSSGSKFDTSSSVYKSTPPTSVDSSSRMEYSSPVTPGNTFGASIAELDGTAFDDVPDADIDLALYGATSAVIDIGNDAEFDFLGTGIKTGAPAVEELQTAEPESEPTLFKIDPENTSLAKAYKELDLGAMWRDRIKAQSEASVKLERKGVADMFEHWNDVVTNAIKNRLDILVRDCNAICTVKDRAVENAVKGTKRYTSTGESLSGQCSDLHLATSGRKIKRLNDDQPQAITAAEE